MTILDSLIKATSDCYFYPILQFFLVGFAFFVGGKDLWEWRKKGRGFSATVIRGNESMGKFYAAYGILTGVFIGSGDRVKDRVKSTLCL